MCLKMQPGFVCLLLLLLPFTRAFNEDSPVVTTSQGRIVGTRLQFSATDPELGRNVDAYLGIPYAEPPVGPLRFKPPVAKSWSGELQATQLGNRCPQPLMPLGNFTMSGPFDEDCLCLDVFVPEPVPPNAAVLLFIHGGAFIIGAGTMLDMYATATAAVGDVIVVATNYRLGALGFFSTGDDVVPGNMGFLDQRLAMEWVRDNIQAFGGDPGRVVIFGESAGAASVGFHMISPGSAGLFRGAILQSGSAAMPSAVLSPPEAARRAFALGKLVGCEQETSQELLECLQQVQDVDIFIENQLEKLLEALGGEMVPFVPVADGEFLPGYPAELHEEGAINDAVSIIGELADEGMLMIMPTFPNNTDEAPFVDSESYDAISQGIMAFMTSPEPIVADAIKLMYRNASCKDAPNCDYLDTLSQVIGDLMFVCSGDRTARAYAKAGRKVYRYHMTHVATTSVIGKKWTKAMHGDDLAFVFGMPLVPSDQWSFTEDEARMSVQTIKYWANLAKTGDPNLSSLDAELTDEEKETEWPLFTLEELAYKDLSPAMLNGRGIKARECLMWNEFIPKLVETAEEARKCREAAESSTKDTKDGSGDSQTCTKDSCPGE